MLHVSKGVTFYVEVNVISSGVSILRLCCLSSKSIFVHLLQYVQL